MPGPFPYGMLGVMADPDEGSDEFTYSIVHDFVLASAMSCNQIAAGQAIAPSSNNVVAVFPTPSGAKWENLRIRFIDGHTVAVSLCGASQQLHYSQMGMANRRNAQPTKQWELLQIFARHDGILTWDKPDADRRVQKRCEKLVRNLKAFFLIDGKPIEYVKQTKGWQTAFTIESDT